MKKMLLLLVFSLLALRHAQSQQAAPSLFSEWSERAAPAIPMTIEIPFRRIVNQKYNEAYFPARISFPSSDTAATISYDFQMRARGNARKKNCAFPPFKWKFSKKMLTEEGRPPFHEIKIANACSVGNLNDDYLFREYLAYKIYNLITPYSFKVCLARISYVDTERKNQQTDLYAILIEPEAELCARLNAAAVEQSVTRGAFLERDLLAQMEVFQYMIGNTDWNIGNRHNMITVKGPERPKLIPIPYDFDYSGLVGANYALPNEVLPITSVKERFHKGEPIEPEYHEPLRLRFLELQPQIMGACKEIAALSPRAAKEAEGYLEEFFRLLKNPKWMAEAFQNR